MDAGAVARAFDPDRLTPLASLNTMPLLDLAGLSVSPASAWRTAYHVLAAPAIAAQVREHADPLGLADTREADDDTVLRHFAGALVAPDPALRMTARTLADRCGDLLALLVATLRRGDAVLSISLASYVHDGQPLPRRGGPYAPLHNLSPNLAVWLADRLLDQLGSRPELVLLHDSSAAALAVPRDPHAAVIMLGTALGVGFPSLTRPLRPRATNFAVLAR